MLQVAVGTPSGRAPNGSRARAKADRTPLRTTYQARTKTLCEDAKKKKQIIRSYFTGSFEKKQGTAIEISAPTHFFSPYFGSASTAPIPALYCHFKMYFNSLQIDLYVRVPKRLFRFYRLCNTTFNSSIKYGTRIMSQHTR